MDDTKPNDEVVANATPRATSVLASAFETPTSRPGALPQDNADPCRNRLRLTIPEAAKWLGISRSQMYEVCRKPGGPPVHKQGRLAFIDCKELVLWYEGKLPDWKAAANNSRHQDKGRARKRQKAGWRWKWGEDRRRRSSSDQQRDGG